MNLKRPEGEKPCGRWVPGPEYAAMRSIGLDEVSGHASERGLLTKTIGGEVQVWVDESAESASSEGPAAGDGAVLGETMPRRFSGVEELALRTERAISLVERSLNTFIMMHQEVVAEKDRYSELTREGMDDRDRLLEERESRIEELEQAIRDKEQEIADLKMLVEIMEGRPDRPTPAAPIDADEAELPPVGDLMEEQLKFIMEDQMVRDLLEE